jgi:hypothetical protein
MLAQRLSDELNAHTTRGGRSADRVGSSSTGGKKAKKASAARKFKSEDTVVDSDDAAPTGKGKRRAASSDDDDSDNDDDERPRAKKAAKTSSGQPRGGAFNKEMALSPALSQLMAGETQVRPCLRCTIGQGRLLTVPTSITLGSSRGRKRSSGSGNMSRREICRSVTLKSGNLVEEPFR